MITGCDVAGLRRKLRAEQRRRQRLVAAIFSLMAMRGRPRKEVEPFARRVLALARPQTFGRRGSLAKIECRLKTDLKHGGKKR